MPVKFNSSNILSQVPQIVFEQHDLLFRVDERRQLMISEIPKDQTQNNVLIENGEDLDPQAAIPEAMINWFEKLILLQREFQEFKDSGLQFTVTQSGLIAATEEDEDFDSCIFTIPSEVLAEVRTDLIGYLRRNVGFAPKRSRKSVETTSNDTLSAPSEVEGALEQEIDDTELDEGIYGADTAA